MLVVSQVALAQLKTYLDGRQIEAAIRITLLKGTCCGPSLRFTVDEAQRDDHLIHQGGVCFIVNKQLVAACGTIRVDFIERFDSCPCSGRNGGFQLSCEHPSAAEGGGCESCCPSACQAAGHAGCLMQENCLA